MIGTSRDTDHMTSSRLLRGVPHDSDDDTCMNPKSVPAYSRARPYERKNPQVEESGFSPLKTIFDQHLGIKRCAPGVIMMCVCNLSMTKPTTCHTHLCHGPFAFTVRQSFLHHLLIYGLRNKVAYQCRRRRALPSQCLFGLIFTGNLCYHHK